MGALAGLLVTQLSLRIGGWVHIRRTTNWSVGDFVPGSEIAYDIAVSSILAAASLAARPWLSGMSWLFVCMPTFAILYLSLTIRKRFLMRIKTRERPGVLMMTQFLEMGGLERVIYSLCTSFRASGEIDPFVLSYDRREKGESLAGEFEESGIGVIASDKGGDSLCEQSLGSFEPAFAKKSVSCIPMISGRFYTPLARRQPLWAP